MAHCYISVISAEQHLTSRGNDVAVLVKTCVYYRLRAAVAYRFDLGYRVCRFKKAQASGEQMRHKVRAQSEAQNGYVALVHYFPQLIYLLRGEELTLIGYNNVLVGVRGYKGVKYVFALRYGIAD